MLNTKIVSVALLSCLSVACGDDGDGGQKGEVVTIDTEGGNYDLGNGVSIDVPTGALSEGVEVQARFVDSLTDIDAPSFADGIETGAGGALVLTPHGTQFEVPVTVTMPSELTGDNLTLWRMEDEESETWESVGPVSSDGKTVSFDTLGFSVYSPQVVSQGACPCFDGSDVDTVFAQEGAKISEYKTSRGRRGSEASMTVSKPGPSLWLQVNESDGDHWCEVNLPAPTGHNGETVDAATAELCRALIRSHVTYGRTGLQAGAFASGLEEGQEVSAEVTVTPNAGNPVSESLVLQNNQEFVWLNGVFGQGDEISVSLSNIPKGMSCISSDKVTLGTVNASVEVVCEKETASSCDRTDLAGMWELNAGGDVSTVAITSAPSGFTFPVQGGSVDDIVVDQNNAVTATLNTDDSYPSQTGSVWACDDNSETLTLLFDVDGGISATLTRQ